MIGLDSNVVIRLITLDHSVQTAQAQAVVADAAEQTLYVNLIVLVEIAWVLNRAYHYDNASVLDAIESVLGGREFMVERESIAAKALATAREARCGYADALIELLNLEAGADVTLTFDIKAKRLRTMRDVGAYK